MLRLTLPTLADATQAAVAARSPGAVIVPRSSADAVLWLTETPQPARRDQSATGDLLDEIARELRSGRAAFVAGDLVPTRDSLETLLQSARMGDTHLFLVNPELHRPSRLLVTQQIASGQLGAVGLVRLHAWDATITPEANDQAPAARIPWRVPPRLLAAIDIALQLVDSAPNVVTATANFDWQSQRSSVPGDSLLVQLGFSSGAMALIDWAQLPPDSPAYDGLSVIAAHGAAYANDESNYQHCLAPGGVQAWRADEQLRTLVNLVQFARTSRGDERASSASVAAWRRTRATVDAVVRALDTRDAVDAQGT